MIDQVQRIMAEAVVAGARSTRQHAAARYIDGRFRYGGRRIFKAPKKLSTFSEFGGFKQPNERRWHGQKA